MTTTTTRKAPAKRSAAQPAKAEPAKKAAASKRTTKKAAPKAEGLAAAAATGKVRFYRLRKNKTRRTLPYLTPGSEARKSAELVVKRRDNGDTIGAIAKDLNASVATVRRLITGLLLAQAVEAGDYDKRYTADTTEIIVNGTDR